MNADRLLVTFDRLGAARRYLHAAAACPNALDWAREELDAAVRALKAALVEERDVAIATAWDKGQDRAEKQIAEVRP